jgi:c-di-GMP-related signal transduction protein
MKIPMQFTRFECNTAAMLREKFCEMLCTCEAQVCPNKSLLKYVFSVLISCMPSSIRMASSSLPLLSNCKLKIFQFTTVFYNIFAGTLSIANLSTYTRHYFQKISHMASDVLYAIYWTTTPELLFFCQCTDHQAIKSTQHLPVNCLCLSALR